MAITRAQQAKQMLQDGGRIGFFTGMREQEQRDKGSDYGQFDRAVSRSQNNPSRTTPSGGGDNKVDVGFQEALRKEEIAKKKKEARDEGFRTTGSVKYSPPSTFQNFRNNRYQSGINRNKFLALQDLGLIPTTGFKGLTGAVIEGFLGKVPENLQDLSEQELNSLALEVNKLKAGGQNVMTNKMMSGKDLLDRTFQAQNLLDSGKMTQTDYDTLFPGPTITKTGDGGDQGDPCKGPNPPAYCFTGIRSAAIEPEEEVFTPNLRLLAEGGMADIDREAFLLGGIAKGLKKAVRAVKKIAKSPIGKAAILGAIGFGIPGVQSGFFSKGLMGTQKGLGFKKFLGDTLFGKVTDLGIYGPGRNARVGGLLNSPLALIGGASALAGLYTAKTGDDEKELYAGADIDDPRTIMANPYNYLNIRNMAEGGSTEKEPVAKKTMTLLDMDGMEKDYREEGGFVPIGRMEKADDVPARLSKNEFVFTADAVRNAGDGDVDKGAEVMYNMMKNLESGGDVSEESQGLEGAREMFQTSKRLEEVL